MSNTTQEVIKVTASEVSKIEKENMMLNERQLKTLLARTPKRYIKERVIAGGKTANYVPTGYVTKVLNIIFGFNWNFNIIGEQIQSGIVIVKGELEVTSNGHTIKKSQYGRQAIRYNKATQEPIDIGNTFKGAASDALKKCASLLGVAADVYSPSEYTEVDVIQEEAPELSDDEGTAKEVLETCDTLEELIKMKKQFVISPAIKAIYNNRFVQIFETENLELIKDLTNEQ